jgi:CRISPR-associated protein Csc2
MFLSSLQAYDVFQQAVPKYPMGKYAHIVMVRETNSFALFQTDGELNLGRVSLGRKDSRPGTRIVLFKRKQSTPERLTGRELLRRYGLVDNCTYNSKDFCKRCPDCIYYGFAIGDQGSERSKVLVDSAFSITPYDLSHQQITFNAPSENGTMSEEGEMRNALGEQDYVLPQVHFPSVVTIKDPTEAEFLYVLNNIVRTKRYGAQNTRTGTVTNHIVGIIFADGEIFSNLELTQASYDALPQEKREKIPLAYDAVRAAIREVIPALLKEDHVAYHHITDEVLDNLLQETLRITSDEEQLRALLAKANQETVAYAQAYGVDAKSTKGKK